LEAVNRLELDHYENVIVFPQVGSRPHPNEMAGGDLDGDTYLVIWDKEIFPSRTLEPLDFTAQKRPDVERVEMKDIAEFFVEYIQNDKLGIISNAILAQLDPPTGTSINKFVYIV
jgi:RNA-dependent RNA polymerase